MAVVLSQTQKDDRKEACKTYIEQTKLLVTLASAFVLAPVALVSYLRNDHSVAILSNGELKGLMWAEGLFVLSVLLGYVVLGAVAGAQQDGSFDVFRRAIRVASLLQLACYLIGPGILAILLTSWTPQGKESPVISGTKRRNVAKFAQNDLTTDREERAGRSVFVTDGARLPLSERAGASAAVATRVASESIASSRSVE